MVQSKSRSKTGQRRSAPDGEALVQSVTVTPKVRKRKAAQKR